MKKLLILSGKGGTGKTTTAAAFIHFSKAKATADCDVDAPNLHMVTKMKTQPEYKEFIGAEKAVIDADKCIQCGQCMDQCRFNAIEKGSDAYKVLDQACEGCAVCEYICPSGAVSMVDDVAGTQRLYRDDESVFSTAELKMGRGNTGKLVSDVKQAMFKNAPETDLAIVDGSPGIGCPVIASVTGMDMVLVVAEPSLSGVSDLKRLVKTARGFQTKLAVCVNKWDSSPEKTKLIEDFCQKEEIPYVGRIPYDKMASKAINSCKSLAEIDCPARDALHEIYQKVMDILF